MHLMHDFNLSAMLFLKTKKHEPEKREQFLKKQCFFAHVWRIVVSNLIFIRSRDKLLLYRRMGYVPYFHWEFANFLFFIKKKRGKMVKVT